MAEVTCPLCGKPNPDDLENCQFCDAALTPGSDTPSIQPGSAPVKMNTAELDKARMAPDDELLRPGQVPIKKNTSELEHALPSWLRAVRGTEDQKPGEEPPAASPAESLPVDAAAVSNEGEFPDWLAGLEAESADDDEGEVPAWIAALRKKPVEEPPDEEEKPPESDWVSETGSKPALEPETTPAEAEELEPAPAEIPDWLARLKSEATLETPAAEAPKEQEPELTPSELPDWLASLKSQDAHETPAAGIPAEQKPIPAEVPDWLASLKSEATLEIPAEETPAEQEAIPAEVPDWLASLKSEATLEIPAEETPAEQEPIPAEVPDWLASLKSEATLEIPAEETPAEQEAIPAEVPDWLASLKSEAALETPAAEIPAEIEAEPFQAGLEVPDWLAGIKPETLATPPAEIPATEGMEPALAGAELPDWLAAIKPEDSLPVEAAEMRPGNELDWLASLPAAEEAPAEAAPEVPVTPPQRGAEIPDWLKGIAAGAAVASLPAATEDAQAPEAVAQPEEAFTLEVPDWLSTVRPDETTPKPTGAPVPESLPEEALETGEVPSWVQAMRPVESAVSDLKPQEEGEAVVERQGPLAGLSGVLPAGPGLGPLRKPPAYSIKLSANENQQRYAAHLEQMVARESQAGQAARPTGYLPARILRWVIAAILILVVAFPILLGSRSVPPFSGFPSEMGPTIDQIDALPANAPVLLVFDYQPAYMGEMNAAAGPLIDYLLITKGARLAFVSTLPTGPALAEWFMQSTQAAHGYQAGQNYINLGYISGGTAGILSFLQDPVAASPVLFNQQDAWTLPPLQGIRSLGDFSMLIVMTDSVDNGRVWVEQAAQVADPRPPLLMAVSAQAEPMIRPYYDANQIQGLVVGLAGGKSLETISRPGFAQAYWDAFSYGLLVAVIVILVGGAWSLVTGIRSRQENPAEGEA